MDIKYIVIEIQTFDGNQVAMLNYDFDDRNLADSKFYLVMSAAAVSALPRHAVVLMTNEGQLLNRGMYKHGTLTE